MDYTDMWLRERNLYMKNGANIKLTGSLEILQRIKHPDWLIPLLSTMKMIPTKVS